MYLQGIGLKEKTVKQSILGVRFLSAWDEMHISMERSHILKRPVRIKILQGTARVHLPPHSGSGIYMFIETWKIAMLLTSLSLLFFKLSGYYYTPVLSRLFSTWKRATEEVLKHVPLCSPGFRARPLVIDWSPQLPATPVHLKQAPEYSEFLICLKTGCAPLKGLFCFFFFKLWKPPVKPKMLGFTSTHLSVFGKCYC